MSKPSGTDFKKLGKMHKPGESRLLSDLTQEPIQY